MIVYGEYSSCDFILKRKICFKRLLSLVFLHYFSRYFYNKMRKSFLDSFYGCLSKIVSIYADLSSLLESEKVMTVL